MLSRVLSRSARVSARVARPLGARAMHIPSQFQDLTVNYGEWTKPVEKAVAPVAEPDAVQILWCARDQPIAKYLQELSNVEETSNFKEDQIIQWLRQNPGKESQLQQKVTEFLQKTPNSQALITGYRNVYEADYAKSVEQGHGWVYWQTSFYFLVFLAFFGPYTFFVEHSHTRHLKHEQEHRLAKLLAEMH
eukprot:TRINITY_DN594_c0_g1_i1.p2 TRINITY_DN594_c0_g1~~TRINITY_DN594_c0_g1_i1.p2  ORF type:complete len:191 (+),score=63.72 TRINITY_DN594_c0_g1_i1:76-648(+)